MSDKNNTDGSDHFIGIGAALFLGYAVLDRLHKWFMVWIKSPFHQAMLGLIAFSLTVMLFAWMKMKREKHLKNRAQDKAVTGNAPGAVYSGQDEKGKAVYIKTKQRVMHTQIVGTTNAGKTESVILPWAIQDMKEGRGLILVDGKADRGLLDKLWAYAVKSGRAKDFRLVSLSCHDESHQFNPLLGGTAEEITERVFNAFEFENPHYRSLQFEVFSQVMRLFEQNGIAPTFLKTYEAISDPGNLVILANLTRDKGLKNWAQNFRGLQTSEREQRTSGLLAALSHFAFGRSAKIFNTDQSDFTIDEALSKNLIVYFQLPVMHSPFLGKATGKMVLQGLQSAIANRHRTSVTSRPFFSVFLDDFSEYLYPGFVSILNKSRSANVGIVFAHQALGDIESLVESVANTILVCSNIKIFMRGNDPKSAEYFSKVIGTNQTVKYTERTKVGLFDKKSTGDASAREVEEFVVHPNYFKRELGVGQAVMIIPHEKGSRTIKVDFDRYPDIPSQDLPKPKKSSPKSLEIPSEQMNEENWTSPTDSMTETN